MRFERRGVVLILALGCMTILTALMTGLIDTSDVTQKMISRREAEVRAAVAARSGVAYGLARLRQRGLRFIQNAVPPPDPALPAEESWIEDLSTRTVTLQGALAPHDTIAVSFTLRVAPESSPAPASADRGFVRDNLQSTATLSQATLFTLTVTGYCSASDGRKMAARTIAQTFVGANVIPVRALETP